MRAIDPAGRIFTEVAGDPREAPPGGMNYELGQVEAVMDADQRPRAIVKTAFDERVAALFPDGRWLAYVSLESGRSEVCVQAFPRPGPKRQVSDRRGADTVSPRRGSQRARSPRWSRDGRELFYWNGNRLMPVPIRPGRDLDSGAPSLVFEKAGGLDFDVAPDGRRFLIAHEIAPVPLTRVVVRLGAAEIGRRAP